MAVVPLALIGFNLVREQKRGLLVIEQELEAAIVDEVAHSIVSQLEDVPSTTSTLSKFLSDERIHAAGSDPSADFALRATLAREALGASPLISYVSIFDGQKKFADVIAKKSAKVPERPQLPAATSGTWNFVGSSLEYIVSFRFSSEEWWLVAHVDAEALQESTLRVSLDRYGELAARKESPSRVVVLDEHWTVLASDAPAAVAIGSSLEGKDVFKALRFDSAERKRAEIKAADFVSEQGIPMVGTVRTLPAQGWYVVARRPQSEVFRTLIAAREAFYQAILFTALAALIVGFFVARRTTNPILSLVSLTRFYGRRDFTKRAASETKTGDEVEVLGSALEGMADSLILSEKEIERRVTVEAGLSRYLPAEVARSVAEGRSSLELGGARRNVTTLFADVVGFTGFAEKASPEEVVAFLNELFSVLSEVVFRHGGMVDKFMGDCIMALFGASGEEGDHAKRASLAALDMHTFVESSAPVWKAKYGIDVKLGIGLSSGDALVGNLGSKTRVEYTAIGDSVNLAARLESLARPGQTLCTEDVSRACNDSIDMRDLGEHPVRGKSDLVRLYEVVA